MDDDPQGSAREDALRAPTSAALVTVVASLPALVVGIGVALLLPGTEGLFPVDGPVSWLVSSLATGFVAFLANLVPVLAWVGLLAWVRQRRGRRVHDLVAATTAVFALGISLGAALAANDAGQFAGLLLAAALLAAAAVTAGRRVPA